MMVVLIPKSMKIVMENLSQNLKTLLKSARLSENELSRRTGVPQQVINRILSGQNKNPKIATLKPIANYFNVSLSQLIEEKQFFNDTRTNPSHLGWNEISLLEWNKLNLDSLNSLIAEARKKILVDVNADPKHCFAIILENNEMEPRFPEGTVLIFDTKKKIKNGSFGLFYIKSEKKFFFRQVFFKEKNKYIKCLNPKFKCYNLSVLHTDDSNIASLIQSKFDY